MGSNISIYGITIDICLFFWFTTWYFTIDVRLVYTYLILTQRYHGTFVAYYKNIKAKVSSHLRRTGFSRDPRAGAQSYRTLSFRIRRNHRK